MSSGLERFKPAVEKRTLLLLSGLAWIAVGFILLRFAFLWLHDEGGKASTIRGGAGLLLALLIHHFGFLKVVDKNLGRILPMVGKKCVFAFQPWRSYLIVIVMIAMGIGLRHSPLPKPYLAVLYSGIGMALVLSSVRYLRFFWKRAD